MMEPTEMYERPDTVKCKEALAAVNDTLYVIGGKWKIRIIIAMTEGNKRFNEIQRALDGISPRMLSNELKELELNGFVKRTVLGTGTSSLVEYTLTEYTCSLRNVLATLNEWGTMHRKRIRTQDSLK